MFRLIESQSLKRCMNRLKSAKVKEVKERLHGVFLRKCVEEGVTPKGLRIRPPGDLCNSEKIRRLVEATNTNIVKERIRQHRCLQYKNCEEVAELTSQIRRELPPSIFSEFMQQVDRAADKESVETKLRHDKKFQNLKPTLNLSAGQPDDVINISEEVLTTGEINLLNKGLDFVPSRKDVNNLEVLAPVEAARDRSGPLISGRGKEEIARVLLRPNSCKTNLSEEDLGAMKSLRSKDNIMILKADKGGKVVVLNKVDYEAKMNTLLGGGEYTKLSADPTPMCIKSLNKLHTELKNRGMLDKELQTALKTDGRRIPDLVGVPKAHKPGVPCRPIIRTFGSPIQPLAKIMARELKLLKKGKFSVKNTYIFKERASSWMLNEGDILVSLDVCNMFTNIPVQETLEIIKSDMLRSGHGEELNSWDLMYMKLLKCCTETNYFTYGNEFFSQVKGLPMGSNISPCMAEIFMEKWEEKIMNGDFGQGPQLIPKYWARYVDDILLVWSHGRESLMEFVNSVNGIHPDIKVTVELENDGCINFLDLTVVRSEDQCHLAFKIYRKGTAKSGILDFNSFHSSSVKRGLLKGEVLRVLRLTDSKFLGRALGELRKRFYVSHYPRKLVEGTIRSCRNSEELSKKQPSYQKDVGAKERVQRLMVMRYQGTASEVVRKVGGREGVTVAFSNNRNLGLLLKGDRPNSSCTQNQANVGVYCIPCGCGTKYVGETGRGLNVRVKEHKADVKNLRTWKPIPAHLLSCKQDFRWDESKILVHEKNVGPRRVIEGLFIRNNSDELCNLSQGMPLDRVWDNVIKNSAFKL